MRPRGRWAGLLSTMLASSTALAAEPSPSKVDDALARYDRAYRRTQLGGMGLLTGWAVANIGGGIAGAVLVHDHWRYVHEMDALWNSVNLVIGIIGLVGNARHKPLHTGEAAARRYRKARRTYAINGGLDMAYIVAGIVTADLGHHYGRARIEGWGEAVVFQGAFLFAFDLGMLIAHERAAAGVPSLRLVPDLGRRRIGLRLGGRF